MRTTPRIKIKENIEVRTGSILLAKPFWQEDIYKRSVILLIDLSSEGSTGVIINKMSNLSVHDALPDINDEAPLFFGGPVNRKTVSYIHSNPHLPESFYLGNNLFWGGSYDSLVEMTGLSQINLNEFRFSAGFVQWKPGELATELIDDKWWVSELNDLELFQLPSEDLWSDKLVEDDHIYGLFNLHPDPSLS